MDLPGVAEVRNALLEKHLPGIDVAHLHQAIRYGVAPAMSADPDSIFWGGSVQNIDPSTAALMGASMSYIIPHNKENKIVTLTDSDRIILNRHKFG